MKTKRTVPILSLLALAFIRVPGAPCEGLQRGHGPQHDL